MKKIEHLNETFDGLSPEYNQFVAYQDKINELVEAVNTLLPSKPSEEESESELQKMAYEWEKRSLGLVEVEAEIRADERSKIAKQIEEFAHKEMKDGNHAYEKLLILLKTFYI